MAGKTTTRRKTGTTAARRRSSSSNTRSKKGSSKVVDFFVPMFFIFCILFCLGFLMFMGYRTAAASSFFDIEKVETKGAENISPKKIEKIVKSHTAKTGVWNADLEAIKSDVNEFKYAKNVSVSRVLPNSIQVVVDERIPKAIVRLDGKNVWVDEDAVILNRVSGEEKNIPFMMFGWDEDNTAKARENNKKRVKLYLTLQEEWQEFDLVSRVAAVNLSDLNDPQAIVTDSGERVTISLGNEEHKKRLQKALEVVAGKGTKIESVITSGVNPIIGYRNS
ncbi:MAG: cell division protein FtsQ/DivIB [Aridibacter sp.]